MSVKRSSIGRTTFTAGEVMSKPVISLRSNDTIHHAAGVLLDKGISGAPVMNAVGQPVGVITKTDIARYEREHVAVHEGTPIREAMRTLGTLELISQTKGFHIESEDERIERWMTPRVFSVGKETSLCRQTRSGRLANISQASVSRAKCG